MLKGGYKKILTLGFFIISPMVMAATETTYDAHQDARIRLYGQNQKPTILKYEHHGKKRKINVGGGAGDAFTSFIGTVKNQSIGIAQTEMSQNLKERNGIFSKVFYKEFIIPSGQPVSIKNAFIGLTNVLDHSINTIVQYEGTCTSSGLIFTPKSGMDYEAIPSQNGAACGVVLLEIDPDGNTKKVSF